MGFDAGPAAARLDVGTAFGGFAVSAGSAGITRSVTAHRLEPPAPVLSDGAGEAPAVRGGRALHRQTCVVGVSCRAPGVETFVQRTHARLTVSTIIRRVAFGGRMAHAVDAFRSWRLAVGLRLACAWHGTSQFFGSKSAPSTGGWEPGHHEVSVRAWRAAPSNAGRGSRATTLGKIEIAARWPGAFGAHRRGGGRLRGGALRCLRLSARAAAGPWGSFARDSVGVTASKHQTSASEPSRGSSHYGSGVSIEPGPRLLGTETQVGGSVVSGRSR